VASIGGRADHIGSLLRPSELLEARGPLAVLFEFLPLFVERLPKSRFDPTLEQSSHRRSLTVCRLAFELGRYIGLIKRKRELTPLPVLRYSSGR
jgi:hypothetical protein